jgi:ferrous iron transport protein A
MSIVSTIDLASLPNKAKAVIAGIHGEGALQQKFLDMGFIPGVEIEKVRSAPLFDPIEVRVLGYNVTLRRQEAQLVEVQAL